MLKKSKISKIKIWTDEWFVSRLAKFTSSEIYLLMAPNGFGEGAINYIRRKVGEEITGKPSRPDELDTNATRHGNFYELEALTKFCQSRGIEILVSQQLITEEGSRFGGTPDGLIPLRISPDETEYEVQSIEVKCPPTFDNYIRLFECVTPQDLKEESKPYYWQVLDQMDNCEALKAYFVVYHPDFKAGNMRVIEFDAMQKVDGKKGAEFPIHNDLKLLRERKKMAVEKFEEIRNKLISIPSI